MPVFDFLRKREINEDVSAQRTVMIVGLGNPGRVYRETRHNIGFMVVDRVAEKYSIKLTRVQNKAIIGSGNVGAVKIILVKPTNLHEFIRSGSFSAGTVLQDPLEDLIVVHDDVDLPFGVIRMRPGGGSAGQKGVVSIIKLVGSQDFARLRMGVGRPPGKMDAADYVLQNFATAEHEILHNFLNRAVEALDCFLRDGLETAMNRFNQVNQE